MRSSPDRRGVDYRSIDPFKVGAQRAASSTDGNIERLGFEVVRESRGESVFIVRSTGDPISLVGGVIETLGTKSLVADAIGRENKSYYDLLAQDTVAMIVNDAAAMGLIPVMVGQLLLIGNESWFDNTSRSGDLIGGWKLACDKARCVFGPGETAALSGIVNNGAATLSGFALSVPSASGDGIVGDVQEGDAIVLLESSGIHANGLTNARTLAASLPDGYETKLSNGAHYGEALLAPTIIYSPIVEDVLAENVPVHYAVHITGHGWRKLMRSQGEFEYVVNKLPAIPEVLKFIVDRTGMERSEAYGTFNMGAGYALYVPVDHVGHVIDVAGRSGVRAWHGGFVGSSSSGRRVTLTEIGVTYEEESLQVR